MLLILLVTGMVLVCVLGEPLVEKSQVRYLQTAIDKGQSLDSTFASFKRIFNRSYENKYEEQMRKKIFEENVQYIKDHNLLFAKGEKSYSLGVNQFTDLTHEEFLQLYTRRIIDRSPSADNGSSFLIPSNLLLPDTVDWRNEGMVTGVKNQGQCGSCWSFSATGSLEGQHKKKSGSLVSLSEQQLIDCSKAYGNNGCQGGLMTYAFEYIKDAGGIESETDYPYEAQMLTCRFESSKVVATVTGYENIASGSETQLQSAAASVGPISVAIDASQQSFQLYSSGIYDEESCSSTKLDHGVLVIGYGTDPSDYWLVKNSWGTSWGEDGYIQMSRNKNNQCGIATLASYPLV